MELPYARQIVDKLKYHEVFVKCCLKSQKFEQALPHVKTLLAYLPDNDQYIEIHLEVQQNLGVSRVDELKRLNTTTKSPLIFKKLIAELKTESELDYFKEILRGDFIKAVRKILPSYFQGIKTIYTCPIKTKFFEELLLKNAESLKTNLRFEGEQQEENPHSEMFVLYLLGQHYLQIGDLDKAMQYCTQAEDFCPTFVEIYLLKAEIYKKQLDYEKAASTLKNIYTIDKADRFLTNITAEYLLLNNEIAEGDTIFKSFIYQAVQPEKSIHTLQKMFYQTWLGKAYVRHRKWGRALRQFEFIYQNIVEIMEDQLEFYYYMLRKTSLTSLVQIVNFNCDSLKSDQRLVRGLGYLVKYALRYKRNLSIEDTRFKAANPNELAPELDKKFKKYMEKRERVGVINCDKTLSDELDLEGKNTLSNIKLAESVKMLAKSQTQDPTLIHLAWSSLFDYYFGQSMFSA